MKLVMQLQAQPNSEQQLGIWANRQSLYRQACQRIRRRDTEHWPHLLLQIDHAIKGVSDDNAWDLLLQAALDLAGVRLFV
jgi:DNA polymerase-3 subunit delta